MFHNAISAWQEGGSGQGTIIAIVDTGIDVDSPEFVGRIHDDSRDVVGNRSFNAVDDHGTNVALISSAARDNRGVVGIAFESTVLALRADEPGSCDSVSGGLLEGCVFNDRDIAAGVDQAIASGATVINLSLGGSVPSAVLNDALRRAADAGIVIVVSAGNDGGSTELGVDPLQPDPFAAGIFQVAGANVIIVGSVDEDGLISDFSNYAGSLGNSYLTARGEAICCSYENGELFVETDENGNQFVRMFSGTSFSAPQVAGAVALLAQAFPNLSGPEIVEILLDSARDAGASGTDSIYGRGILDIAAAFRPSGTTTLAGSTLALAQFDASGFTSVPMGDAASSASIPTIVTDRYGRAFNYNLGGGLRSAQARQPLYGVVGNATRRITVGAGGISTAFTVAQPRNGASALPLDLTINDAEQARILAARIALRISPDTTLAFGISEGADGLVGQLQGQDRPAFMVARPANGDTGFARSSDVAFAARHEFGGWGLTVHAEDTEVHSSISSLRSDRLRFGSNSHPAQLLGLTLDRQFGSLESSLGVSLLSEHETILGARFHEAFGPGGADTLFADVALGWRPASNWRLGATYRYGITRPHLNQTISDGSELASMAWSFDITREGIFAPADMLGLRISQPLRVESGNLNLTLPVAYDYSSETPIYGQRSLFLAPEGREIVGELSWHSPLWGGDASTGLFVRHQPGNIAAAQQDIGAAIKWTTRF